MKRKITKQKTAYTVTLPVNWIRENNLKGSDEIEVTEEGNDILISSSLKQKRTEKEVSFTDEKDHYIRIIIENEYLKGTHKLKVKYNSKKIFGIIEEVVDNLIGFEIIETSEEGCSISETAMATEKEFDSLLKRLLQSIDYAGEFIQESFANNNFKDEKTIKKIIDNTRRFSLFCRRVIHTSKIVTRQDETFFDLLLERLVIINYENYFMFLRLSKKNVEKLSKNVLDFYNESYQVYNLFRKMFIEKNNEYFQTINQLWEKNYFIEGPKLLEKANFSERIIIIHSLNIFYLGFLIAQPNTAFVNATPVKG